MNIRMLMLLSSLALYAGLADALVITAGLEDGFTGPSDPASPSSALSASVGTAMADFDVEDNNANVAHTFADLPTNSVGGTLRFRVRAGSGLSNTDGIILSFVTNAGDNYLDEIVYRRTYGLYGGGGTVFSDPDDGLLTPGAVWVSGSDESITLDLAALPLSDGGVFDILPSINGAGFLDVLLGDDSVVDFVELQLQAVPAPPTAVIFLSLLPLLGCFRGTGLLLVHR